MAAIIAMRVAACQGRNAYREPTYPPISDDVVNGAVSAYGDVERGVAIMSH